MLYVSKFTRNLYLMPESINGSRNGWTWSECESLGFCVDELLFVSPGRLSMALKYSCVFKLYISLIMQLQLQLNLMLQTVMLSIILIGDSWLKRLHKSVKLKRKNVFSSLASLILSSN